ncbi:NAD(P)-binding protein [Sulfolobus acidocaldarius]|uniref:Conserved protein n=4 Tax=Sulfolobus acidocaldarius TaxID=2285 RepID=Q4JAQ9_SULAC|nr:FAD/NAD(P)-binding protein [Sulfolobus acidocaldarius]AAY80120.1 conserved protein [Sulfolobus acidocaldarius DSM 639]AGE70695.1 hypothetical protein SacN8_03615 [Sulfolobus acidocaldarius N8]AGE72967.1 hypothetical protein SacRon12I_03600 [Sulfolobus acidocaldarius Ron12/I]ALU28965.1 hypothetical protein ATY89_02690 [Sulfolobus acidocaldarius]ALU31692.1 hypothetical protein ATZ20_05715 [Sulfolobus acidocaldarius]
MEVILGAGISGLLISSRKRDSIVLENQHRIGGVFSYDEISGFNIPLHPPLVKEKCFTNLLDFAQIETNVIYEKENYLSAKLTIDKIPDWLLPDNKMYYIKNLSEIIQNLSLKARIRLIGSYFIRNDKLVLNTGEIILWDRIYSTIPRRIFDNSKIFRSISIAEAIFTTKKRQGSQIVVNGDKGVSFSHVFSIDWLNPSFDVLYVLVPFLNIVPSWDKVYSDLKRKRILLRDEIISFRYRIIKDGILIDEDNKIGEKDDNIIFCGRLGKWKNFNLCQTIDDSLNC